MTAPRRPPLRLLQSRAIWFFAAALCLVVASFWSLDMQWGRLAAEGAPTRMGRFMSELLAPQTSVAFLRKLVTATLETLAMSALGTALAVVGGILLALPAARTHSADAALWRGPTRFVLNTMRSIPELVWATLLLISAGLGPLAGTLALALHTTGVLGRLFAEALENALPGPASALRVRGISEATIFWYATLPQIVPQLLSYTLYRWENNIRAAAVLGVVGAGGLGALLSFHLALFQMPEASTVLIAMLFLVAMVDGVSGVARKAWMR